MTFKVPVNKIKSLQKDIQSTLTQIQQSQPLKLRHFARVIGKIMAMELAILPTRMKTWEMIKCKNQNLQVG